MRALDGPSAVDGCRGGNFAELEVVDSGCGADKIYDRVDRADFVKVDGLDWDAVELGLGFGYGTGRGFLSENGQCLGEPEGDVAFLGSQRASGSESDASGAESWIGPTPRGFGLGLGSTGSQFQGLQAGMSIWDRPGQSVDSRRRHDLGTALQGHQ
jgi:hypothetical protein